MDIFTLIALLDLLKQSGVITDVQWIALHENLQANMNSGVPFIKYHNELVEAIGKTNPDIALRTKAILINEKESPTDVIRPVKKIILPGRG